MNFSKASCRKSLLGSIGITASANSCRAKWHEQNLYFHKAEILCAVSCVLGHYHSIYRVLKSIQELLLGQVSCQGSPLPAVHKDFKNKCMQATSPLGPASILSPTATRTTPNKQMHRGVSLVFDST